MAASSQSSAVPKLNGMQKVLVGATYQIKLTIVACLANAKQIMEPDSKFGFTVAVEHQEDSQASNPPCSPDKLNNSVNISNEDGGKKVTEKNQPIDELRSSANAEKSNNAVKKIISKTQGQRKEDSKPKQRDRETPDKFDDIVYTFIEDKVLKATIKIQSKYRLTSTLSTPTIGVNDFTTEEKKDFNIEKYYKSFCYLKNQQQQTNEICLTKLVVCTNAVLDDNAGVMWNAIDPAVIGNSTFNGNSADSLLSSLFKKVGATCYQLKTNYENATLAEMLINAIKSQDEKVDHEKANLQKYGRIDHQTTLFKKYRSAILDIIDKKSYKDDLCEFTATFINPSSPNPSPDNEPFRKEFENQYRQKFQTGSDESVWEDLKLKRVFVSKAFLSDENPNYSSSKTFPKDNVDSDFKLFCEQFRLVCASKEIEELDDVIEELWKDLYSEEDHSALGEIGTVESKMAFDTLFETTFNWVKQPNGRSFESQQFKEVLEKIQNTFVFMRIRGVSNYLNDFQKSTIHIKPEKLKESELFKKMETCSIHALKSYDIEFGKSLLYHIADLQGKNHYEIFFLDESSLRENVEKIKTLFRNIEHPCCLIIIMNKEMSCEDIRYLKDLKNENPSTVPDDVNKMSIILKEWQNHFSLTPTKQVFLISEARSSTSGLENIPCSHVTEDSWNKFFNGDIPLFTTTISQNNFGELPIEAVLKFGKQMEGKNDIVTRYRQIENIYVNRLWISNSNKTNTDSVWDDLERKHMSNILETIVDYEDSKMSFMKIRRRFKKHAMFYRIFKKVNSLLDKDYLPEGSSEKVFILLGEAGFGKSTNLTWLAWHLQQQNSSSWVVRCNLSDHSTTFKSFTPGKHDEAGKVIDEAEAMKMLFMLVCSSLQLERSKAEICAKCLVLSGGQVGISKEKTKQHGLSSVNSIQLLVFKEKFNAGELVLLLDGFDEIAPNYKKTVLDFLSLFKQFTGVKKLYVTSRPYNFKEDFAKTNPAFYQLNPLPLHDKGSMLYKMLEAHWHDKQFDVRVKTDFYKVMCVILLYSLNELSNVPLNLTISKDIFLPLVDQHVRFDSNTIDLELFKKLELKFKPSFIVEEFVKTKIRHQMFDKKGTPPTAADDPSYVEAFEEKIGKSKLKHGLLAMRVLFDNKELDTILDRADFDKVEEYEKEINEGKEKTGIIIRIQDNTPIFIHRTFAEYLSAWWIVKQRTSNSSDISNVTRFLSKNRREISKYVDIILAYDYEIHLAIIENDFQTIKSVADKWKDEEFISEKDSGDRTRLLLFVRFTHFSDVSEYLPTSLKNDKINDVEKLFQWTALDYAFDANKQEFIFYLLNHGASINVEILYDQVTSNGHVNVRAAAAYAKYVMQYLSRNGIEYKSSNMYKNIKQFCDKIYVKVKEYFDNFRRTVDIDYDGHSELSNEEERIFKDIIEGDSVWMLESFIELFVNGDHLNFNKLIRNTFYDFALESESIFVLKCFMATNSSGLKEEDLRKCIEKCVSENYINEFKWFFDVYCLQIRVIGFQPSSIHADADPSNIVHVVIDKDIQNSIASFESASPEISIHKDILQILLFSLINRRLSMLKYLITSCQVQFSKDVVIYIALEIHKMYKRAKRSSKDRSEKHTYNCLLDQIGDTLHSISNEVLRHAITSDLFEFSLCLVERYAIDIEIFDHTNNWNVFHLCVSRPHSMGDEDVNSVYELFLQMLQKTESDRKLKERKKQIDFYFEVCGDKSRSILVLAIENGHNDIVKLILAHKLQENPVNDLDKLCAVLSENDLPNLIFCCQKLYVASREMRNDIYYHKVLYMMADQIAKIAFTIKDKSNKQPNEGYLLLKQHATSLYQMAVYCNSLSLMFYLDHKFDCTIPVSNHEAEWLACIAKSMKSPHFRLFKWMVDQYCVGLNIRERKSSEHIDYEVVYNLKYYQASINYKELAELAKTRLSCYLLEKEVSIIMLVILSLCLKQREATEYLCETRSINVDLKLLNDIMAVAKMLVGRIYGKPDFDRILKYLANSIENPHDSDTEGRNVLHRSVERGLCYVARYLIIHDICKVATINDKNGWNALHYCVDRKPCIDCCNSANEDLFRFMLKWVLENDENTFEDTPEYRAKRIKQICFNSDDKRKSVIRVAFEADNIDIVEYLIGSIMNLEEYTCLRECYDELYLVASSPTFNAKCEMFLDRMAEPIDSLFLTHIQQTFEHEKAEDHIVEDACRAAIKYRSLLTLEYLTTKGIHRMNQPLAESSSRELFACIMECIRRNQNQLFRVFVGHYRNVQCIEPIIEDVYAEEENHIKAEDTIKESRIQWSVVNEIVQDEPIKRDYLPLLILSSAYGRLPMTKSLIQMLQLKVNTQLILLLVKATNDISNCALRVSVFEYLSTQCKGNPNLLHLSAQGSDEAMVRYLIKEKKLDPKEIDLDNRWNTVFYCVSEPTNDNSSRKIEEMFQYLMDEMNMDYLAVHDRKGRSVLHLALENGHKEIVDCIIKHILGISHKTEIPKGLNLEKINECIHVMQQIHPLLPGNKSLLDVLQQLKDWKQILTSIPS